MSARDEIWEEKRMVSWRGRKITVEARDRLRKMADDARMEELATRRKLHELSKQILRENEEYTKLKAQKKLDYKFRWFEIDIEAIKASGVNTPVLLNGNGLKCHKTKHQCNIVTLDQFKEQAKTVSDFWGGPRETIIPDVYAERGYGRLKVRCYHRCNPNESNVVILGLISPKGVCNHCQTKHKKAAMLCRVMGSEDGLKLLLKEPTT